MKRFLICFCTMLVLICFAGTFITIGTMVYAQEQGPDEEEEEEPPTPEPDDELVDARRDRLSWVNLQKSQALTTVKCAAIKSAKLGNGMRVYMINIKAALESAKIRERVTVEFHFPIGETKLGATHIYKLGSYSPEITENKVLFSQIPNTRSFNVSWDPGEIKPSSGQYNGILVFKDEKGAVKAQIDAMAVFETFK
jgi:hypothetical protein